MLRQEIAGHRLLPPDANRLYVVYLPPEVRLTGNNLSGYHSMNFDLLKGTIYYAVITDQSALYPMGYPGGLTSFQKQTAVTSHELAEAVTDPNTVTGWRDYNPFSKTKGDEIGDISQDLARTSLNATGVLNGYVVQKEWSNRANASILVQSQPGWNDLGGQALVETVAAHTRDGHQIIFTLTSNGAVSFKEQDALLSPTWGLWGSLGGNVQAITVAADVAGCLQVFALGKDGAIYLDSETTANGLSWSGWSNLGGHDLRQMTVTANADGRLEVFALGGDWAVYHQWQTLAGTWSGWAGLGGYVQAITVGHDRLGRLEVAALGMDRAAYLIGQVTPNGGWGPWTGLGGYDLRQLLLANQADGRLVLFALGGDYAVYARTEGFGGPWTAWAGLGGYVQSIQVGHDAAYRLQVVAVGFNNHIYRMGQTQRNAGFGSWVDLGGNMISVALENNTSGDLLFYGLGNDHALYRR
jgi:hypothetical protein